MYRFSLIYTAGHVETDAARVRRAVRDSGVAVVLVAFPVAPSSAEDSWLRQSLRRAPRSAGVAR